MKTISFTLALAFLVAPALTQARGSINQDAPSVTRTINFKNGDSVSTTYKAIRFGVGSWQVILNYMDGQEALHSTLISPSGEYDHSESRIIGKQDSMGSDSSLEWSFTYYAIPAGDYSIALDLGALDGADIRIGTIEL